MTVARTGSFGRAAREHGISQPAVSSRVNNIERLMRMALFDRSAEGVRPTPDGALVVEWADSLLASAARFEEALTDLHRSSRARLGIAASRTAAEYLIPPLLVTMQAENPGVDVFVTAMSSAEVALRLACGQVNLGFIEAFTCPCRADVRHGRGGPAGGGGRPRAPMGGPERPGRGGRAGGHATGPWRTGVGDARDAGPGLCGQWGRDGQFRWRSCPRQPRSRPR